MEQTVCGHPPPGDQPQNWRATVPSNGGHQPQDWAGKPLRFNPDGVSVFILDFSGYVSEVARGRGTYVGGSVGLVYHVPIILSLALVL